MIRLTELLNRSLFKESKKLRIFDFDDTLVKTKSFIYITHKDGRKSKLTPGEYATYKERPGDEFDYSDFQQVKDPTEIKKMTKVFKTMAQRSKGDLFILTARAAYKPIKDYLKDIGVKNVFVVALASNNPQDKADWIEDKIDNDGYDDIFFADDSPKNVSVTKKMLSSKPNIKYRVQHIKY